MHSKSVICHNCNTISHLKCATKGNRTYKFDQIKDIWTCWQCQSYLILRYNPFDSVFYNKYLIDDNDAMEEISQTRKLLDNCNTINLTDFDKKHS